MKDGFLQLIDQRLELIHNYQNKIQELNLLIHCLGKDLVDLYKESHYAQALYEVMKECFDNNDREHQKSLKIRLEFFLGNHNFKYDFSKLANYNYSQAYIIPFKYQKRTYELHAASPNMLEPEYFYDGKHWIDDLGMALYEREKEGHNSVTLKGSALLLEDLQKLILDKVINRKDN